MVAGLPPGANTKTFVQGGGLPPVEMGSAGLSAGGLGKRLGSGDTGEEGSLLGVVVFPVSEPEMGGFVFPPPG